MRTSPKIQHRRELLAALGGLIPPTGVVISQAAGTVTVNFTANEDADDTHLQYSIDAAAWVAQNSVTSPWESTEELLEPGETCYARLRSQSGTTYGPWSTIKSVSNGGSADPVSADPCSSKPPASATRSKLIVWLADAGIEIEDPASLNKSELWTLINDYCDDD